MTSSSAWSPRATPTSRCACWPSGICAPERLPEARRDMSQLVDRRLSGKNRSAVNRQRFLRRFKAQIRKAAAQVVSGRKVTDLERGDKVSIPAKDLSEPIFHHGAGGRRNIVLPGNREFDSDDRVDRPEDGGGGGGAGGGSPDGEGM